MPLRYNDDQLLQRRGKWAAHLHQHRRRVANDVTSRQISGPSGSRARYDLYSDLARSNLWGSWETAYDTTGVQLDVGKGSTTNITVCGRFFASQQTLATGSYSATFSGNPFIRYAKDRHPVRLVP
jgi:hypothetical protein